MIDFAAQNWYFGKRDKSFYELWRILKNDYYDHNDKQLREKEIIRRRALGLVRRRVSVEDVFERARRHRILEKHHVIPLLRRRRRRPMPSDHYAEPGRVFYAERRYFWGWLYEIVWGFEVPFLGPTAWCYRAGKWRHSQHGPGSARQISVTNHHLTEINPVISESLVFMLEFVGVIESLKKRTAYDVVDLCLIAFLLIRSRIGFITSHDDEFHSSTQHRRSGTKVSFSRVRENNSWSWFGIQVTRFYSDYSGGYVIVSIGEKYRVKNSQSDFIFWTGKVLLLITGQLPVKIVSQARDF